MATKKDHKISKADSKKPIAVRVHPINVGQGDAILLEVKYDKGSSKKWLIDGGRGQKSTFSNLITALDENDCISISTDGTYQQIKLESIVNTHPDADHYGGINALLGTGNEEIRKLGEKFTVCCPIITTEAASLYVTDEIPGNETTYEWYHDHDAGDCPHFWFPKERGLVLENLHQQSTVEIKKNDDKRDCNETSVLTTVQIPGSTYDYDVVLTGDSNGEIILDTLKLKSEKDKLRKTVGVFQVPHHGSKNNSTCTTKGEGSYLSCHTFYMEFDADIYLISHGNHRGYDHPHSEVITGILSAAVKKEQHCKIVVTATRFNGTKIIEDDTVSNWRYYVDIYNFPPYVTLDPNDVKPPEGLKLYNKKVPAPSLEEKLAKNNLQRREVIDHDGNSFFKAVSKALEHKQNSPTELRKRLVKHLKTNSKLYYSRLGATSMKEYKTLCSLDGPLSSNIEKILPEAMAQTLRMQIKVIPANPKQEDKFYGTEPAIQLLHDIDHYDYVLPITSPGDTINKSDALPLRTTETPLKRKESPASANGTLSRRKLVLPAAGTSKICNICKKSATPKTTWYDCKNPKCPVNTHTTCEEKSRKKKEATSPYCKYCRTKKTK